MRPVPVETSQKQRGVNKQVSNVVSDTGPGPEGGDAGTRTVLGVDGVCVLVGAGSNRSGLRWERVEQVSRQGVTTRISSPPLQGYICHQEGRLLEPGSESVWTQQVDYYYCY